jgi:hypothetical protein
MKTQAYAADRMHRKEEVGRKVKFNLKITKEKIQMEGTRMKNAELSTFEVITS